MKSIQSKVRELLADKKVRHTFASKVASLFRELSDYPEDIETEWDLFKSAVIASAAASCGCKWEVKWVVRKEPLGEPRKLKKLSIQRKLLLELG